MLSETTWLLIAIGSAVTFGFAGWWMKVSQMKGGDNTSLLLGLYITGTAGFFVQCLLDGGWQSLGSGQLWLYGAVIGAGSAWGNAVFMKALQHGPASLTSPITNLNIVFVIALSVFLYGETLGPWEAAGISLLLASAVLIAIRPAEQLSLASRIWFLYTGAAVLLFTFRNGGLKVTGELGLPSSAVLFSGYLLSLCWFAWQARSARNGNKEAVMPGSRLGAKTARTIGLRFGMLAGLFSYGGLQLYALALETGKANLAAPIFATNSLVVAAGSILLYRERLTRLQWLAFGCLMAGLVMVRL
ncbi:EamA family transporter [Paenibacillus pasadenensis]|uniref:EamA family transporter n=1 Tax=Paenibacillus pasadenensis TaxID=217090 RepID=UPI00203AE61F|nr:EamA family transporter [Paenibacillus pasadenensis]